MELYPGAGAWENDLKSILKKHQEKLLPCEYAGIIPLNDTLLLATTCDGIGTKILLADSIEDYYNLAIDNVGMNLNDLICCGAKPLAFTNILSRQQYNPEREAALLKGMVDSCEKFGCTLTAGETADVPDLVHDFDLVGSATGVLTREEFLNPKKTVKEGCFIYGVNSNSPHSNGYTLIRKHYNQLSSQLKTWVKKTNAPLL